MSNCGWCKSDLSGRASTARFCGSACRQAAYRFRCGVPERERAERSLRIAYADPPYPGKSRLYRAHKDYAGEVDLPELFDRLKGFDGWALSTSAESLPIVCSQAVTEGLALQIAAWVRGTVPGRGVGSWEPVLYVPVRRQSSVTPGPPLRPSPSDSLVYALRARRSDRDRVIGAKPASFCYWLFDLLGARPGDQFVDLYPGSGGVSRAWAVFESASVTPGPPLR